MERLNEAVARVLAGLRAQLDERKAGGAVQAPPVVAARRVDLITARMGKEAHDTTPKKRSQQKATHKAIGVMRR